MRLRTDFWVAAYLRTRNRDRAAAVLRRRGAAEAGAIFIKVDCLDGRAALFGPAPQTEATDDGERRFVRTHVDPYLEPHEVEARLRREIGFDEDLWIVEFETADGDPAVEIVTL